MDQLREWKRMLSVESASELLENMEAVSVASDKGGNDAFCLALGCGVDYFREKVEGFLIRVDGSAEFEELEEENRKKLGYKDRDGSRKNSEKEIKAYNDTFDTLSGKDAGFIEWRRLFREWVAVMFASAELDA